MKLASTSPIKTNIYRYVETYHPILNPVGKRLVLDTPYNTTSDQLRIAVICNWDSECGIATYTKYLVDAIASKIGRGAIKIFSEKTARESLDTDYDVSYCWTRGETMRPAIKEIIDWKPSVVSVQHEYGIFPKTSYWLQTLQMLENAYIPYVVTMHSVYEHLDKTVGSSAMKHIICHSETGRGCLSRLGHKNMDGVYVVPHGCVQIDDENRGELWNTWQTDYPIVQFGFGFSYKGIEMALEAISILKNKHGQKYNNIFYTYFCSDNEHTKNVTSAFIKKLNNDIERLGVENNVAIIRGFQSEQSLNNCIRTSRLVIFPYKTDPKNVVYGASGAVRIAMANGVPVIASSSHMFDDLSGVVPRPDHAQRLADEIDRVFSDGAYRQGILDRSSQYIKENHWDITADRYLGVFRKIIGNQDDSNVIYVRTN